MRTISVSELDGMYIVWNGTRGKTFESEDKILLWAKIMVQLLYLLIDRLLYYYLANINLHQKMKRNA